MRSRSSTSLLVLANTLIPISILTFAAGFFPYKAFLSGTALSDDPEDVPSAPFDKIVFMVVDALRSDFVYGNNSGFTFTQSLVRSGAAIPFTAHARSPTITMPRVKAITTGSIPSFLDVILNFAESDTTATLANQDTWLAQLKAKPGGKLVMYGDDTWLKLFPGTFSRADGTSSFFVSDFAEVDNNVTRHVPSELLKTDWNGMFMHYLGLDHIGHKSGPRSPYMIPKQSEMDEIVRQVYEAIKLESHLRSTLLVLCGDHGMNDAGNHGGSTDGETSPALLFISPKLEIISTRPPCPPNEPSHAYQYYDVVEQSDLVPTLAGLLGFPVPLNNIGVFIPDFLPFWPSGDDKIQLMIGNARQILGVVQATFTSICYEDRPNPNDCAHPSSDGRLLHCLWGEAMVSVNDHGVATDVTLTKLIVFSRAAQEIMSSTASNYDVPKLNLGVGIAALAALFVSPTLTVRFKFTAMCAALVAFGYGVMMFASSYVEEEQHFWYWIASAWLLCLYLKTFTSKGTKDLTSSLSAAVLLTILRIIRRWNQTGQKYSGDPDIAKNFLPTHNLILWSLVVATYLDLAQRLARRALMRMSRLASTILATALCLASFSFKVSYTKVDAPELLSGLEGMIIAPVENVSLVTQAWTVFLIIGLVAVYVVYRRFYEGSGQYLDIAEPIHDLLTLFLITQSRVNNVPLFLLFELQMRILSYLHLSADEVTQTSTILQHASFFTFGGSNAISSIDLSNAYNGISRYSVNAVGILTFLSNWAGPVWWMSASTLLLLKVQHQSQQDVLLTHISLLTFFAASTLSSVMLACTVLRTHLFIWTVFSPKYLYSMAWSFGQHLSINVLLGSILFWLGSQKPSDLRLHSR